MRNNVTNLSALVIVRVVGGGYFHGTGAEVAFDHLVANDRQLTIGERMLDFFAVQVLLGKNRVLD